MKKTSFFIYFIPIILVVFFLITKNFEYDFEEYEISKRDEKKIEYFIKDYMCQYNQVLDSKNDIYKFNDIFEFNKIVFPESYISSLKKFLTKDSYNELLKGELREKLLNSQKGKNYFRIFKPSEPEIKKIIKEDDYFRVSVVITYQIEKNFYSDISYSQYEKEYLEFVILKIYNEDGSSSFIIDRFENSKIL